jgi:DNA-binding XRE family transcriptional regulator
VALSSDVAARFQASLRRHRDGAGLTLAAMGERIGMKPQSLSRMETEAGYVPKLTTAHLIASFFGEDISTFINVGVDRTGEGA